MPTRERARVSQRSKGAIDPAFGRRLYALRKARKLTQADLAGTDFSKGFISLLETGRTRASLRAAEILATRLGVSVSDLMEAGVASSSRATELTVLRAEAAFGSGNREEAMALIDALPKTMPPVLRLRVQRLRGRSLVVLGRGREGLKELESALRSARELGQHELVVRMLYDLTQAHEALDEPGAAVQLALECDARLQSGELVDRTLELQVRSSLAIGFSRLGDARSAQLQAERALELAQDVTDKRAIASLYTTLTNTRQQQGDLEAAITYAHRAVAAIEALGEAAAIVGALNNVAWIHAQRGEYVRSSQVLDRAFRLAEAEKLEPMHSALLSTRAEARLAQGAAADALTDAEDAASRAGANAQTRGLALLIAAQAKARLARPLPEVRESFSRAITVLRGRSPRLQAKAHRGLADYLAARGRSADAFAEAEKAMALLDSSS